MVNERRFSLMRVPSARVWSVRLGQGSFSGLRPLLRTGGEPGEPYGLQRPVVAMQCEEAVRGTRLVFQNNKADRATVQGVLAPGPEQKNPDRSIRTEPAIVP